jgi:hypothetical protein
MLIATALHWRLLLQGAGKSTFAKALVARASMPWERVNQDSLGSQERCEKAARIALLSGKSIVIDRCNFDVDQRATWLRIAAMARVPCIALWLQYPEALAAARAQNRLEHEGNVTGTKGQAISRKMSRLIRSWHSSSLFLLPFDSSLCARLAVTPPEYCLLDQLTNHGFSTCQILEQRITVLARVLLLTMGSWPHGYELLNRS